VGAGWNKHKSRYVETNEIKGQEKEDVMSDSHSYKYEKEDNPWIKLFAVLVMKYLMGGGVINLSDREWLQLILDWDVKFDFAYYMDTGNSQMALHLAVYKAVPKKPTFQVNLFGDPMRWKTIVKFKYSGTGPNGGGFREHLDDLLKYYSESDAKNDRSFYRAEIDKFSRVFGEFDPMRSLKMMAEHIGILDDYVNPILCHPQDKENMLSLMLTEGEFWQAAASFALVSCFYNEDTSC
jgi:hypothetical protein